VHIDTDGGLLPARGINGPNRGIDLYNYGKAVSAAKITKRKKRHTWGPLDFRAKSAGTLFAKTGAKMLGTSITF
jgi:hypothetical protein